MRKPCETEQGKVLKLKKVLYGLKKAPYYWHRKFDEFMKKEEFKKSNYDNCVYYKESIYLLIYVDDIIITGSTDSEVVKLKQAIKREFKIKDLGKLSYYLGMSVVQDIKNSVIYMNQKLYLLDILRKFDMHNCNSVSTPMENNFNCNDLKREKPESPELETKCRQIIGSILRSLFINYIIVAISKLREQKTVKLSQTCAQIHQRHSRFAINVQQKR